MELTELTAQTDLPVQPDLPVRMGLMEPMEQPVQPDLQDRMEPMERTEQPDLPVRKAILVPPVLQEVLWVLAVLEALAEQVDRPALMEPTVQQDPPGQMEQRALTGLPDQPAPTERQVQ